MISIYLTETITIISQTSVDQWGEPTEAETTGIASKTEWVSEYIKNEKGEDVKSLAHIYLAYRDLDKHKDKVKIDGVRYSILRIVQPKMWSVDNHTEIWINRIGG
jgi:hypothetical protein